VGRVLKALLIARRRILISQFIALSASIIPLVDSP
jgi:hypothetical protein